MEIRLKIKGGVLTHIGSVYSYNSDQDINIYLPNLGHILCVDVIVNARQP